MAARVPVRLPDGSSRASTAQLARELGCAHSALHRHVVEHRGGYAVLGSLPNPANLGSSSSTGRRSRRGVPVLLPGEDTPRPSMSAAARALGTTHNALYPHVVDERGGVLILGSLPKIRQRTPRT